MRCPRDFTLLFHKIGWARLIGTTTTGQTSPEDNPVPVSFFCGTECRKKGFGKPEKAASSPLAVSRNTSGVTEFSPGVTQFYLEGF